MMKPTICYSALFMLVMTSCQAPYTDISNQQPAMIISGPGNYQFGSPIWLSSEVIVVVAKPIDADRTTPSLFLSYNLSEQQWTEIRAASDQDCQILGFSFLERLPDSNLGYVNTCIADGKEIRTIVEVDIKTGKVQKLMGSESINVAGKFSFSPDMSELVQEDMISRFLSNKIFYISNDNATQIVPSFTRAMYPDWSPHERKIAFWGTESYPDGKPNDFTTLPEIFSLSSHPWYLFTSTPEGKDVVRIISSVEDALLIRWSPTERIIAFSGTVDGNSGVFLVNPKTSEIIRIWSRLADFYWSPDGTKMMILDIQNDQNEEVQNQKIYVVSIK